MLIALAYVSLQQALSLHLATAAELVVNACAQHWTRQQLAAHLSCQSRSVLRFQARVELS